MTTAAPHEEATRAKLLEAARTQFADRGFYGASIAQIAGEVGLTKQALLYHFKRKEDLYAELLQQISRRLTGAVRMAIGRSDQAERQLEDVFMVLYASSREHPLDTRILLRELLDNRARAEKAKDWYLKSFLDEIVAVLQRVSGFEKATFAEAFTLIYQLIGSVEYFSISGPTLRQMYGDEELGKVRERFPEELRAQVHRLIAAARG